LNRQRARECKSEKKTLLRCSDAATSVLVTAGSAPEWLSSGQCSKGARSDRWTAYRGCVEQIMLWKSELAMLRLRLLYFAVAWSGESSFWREACGWACVRLSLQL
jgi:hypothetical protein